MTLYVILVNENGLWRQYDEQPASSPDRAVRASSPTPEEGIYVAVPKRSWKPLAVRTETKTSVTAA
jgi:hypothetical protein